MFYELFGYLHRFSKKILGKSTGVLKYRLVSFPSEFTDFKVNKTDVGKFFNETACQNCIVKEQTYPVENVVPLGAFQTLPDSFVRKTTYYNKGANIRDCEKLWNQFIENSKIPEGYRNCGLHYAGFIAEADEWCLPSWIWTNAAIVRMYCATHQIEKAVNIAERLLALQQESGGWIVRNDYDSEGAIPVLAPNDSAYIANNAMLAVYRETGNQTFLDSAKRCADWIINTARPDGLVYVGYNVKDGYWQKKSNIVDIGFTGGLMSELYLQTGDATYKSFLKRFIDRYIDLFYMPDKQGFATGLDSNDHVLGGMFGRGQAWALEGLIPAYRVLKEERIKKCIEETICTLLSKQNWNGAWAYNLTRPYMGLDCKATSIIAWDLMQWYKLLGSNNHEISTAANKALNWCIKNTITDGRAAGGVFSYTTEGAIVHHMYTNTAFVYASSYALELCLILKDYKA